MMRVLDYDVIMMALPRWDGPYSSTAYSLAKALSRYTRVFYMDNPVSVKEYVKRRDWPELKRRRDALFFGRDFFTSPDPAYPDLFAVTPRMTLPVNWLPPGFLYDTLSRLNDSAISSTLNHLLRIFGIRRYVLINSFNPLIGRRLSLRVKPALTIYQSVDDISQAPYMLKHGPRLEREAIRKSDFTIVTSSELRRLKSFFSDKVFLLPNAANISLFQQAAKQDLLMPPEIRALPQGRKIIVYVGNICQRLDYELLKKVAAAHPDKILLMIGPLTRDFYEKSGLSTLPNVVFTGSKKIEALPAYIKYCDCCIIPFVCNKLTKSIYPLKINEYLAAGKPVVSTDFSDDILSFRDVIFIAGSHDKFVNLIDKAIEEDTEKLRDERMIFSESNNWDARACHFIEITGKFLNQHDGRPGTGKRERRKQKQAVYG